MLAWIWTGQAHIIGSASRVDPKRRGRQGQRNNLHLRLEVVEGKVLEVPSPKLASQQSPALRVYWSVSGKVGPVAQVCFGDAL